MDRFADLDGIRLCYRDEGPQDAPAVLLVTGLGMQLTEWPDTLVARLAKTFRVIRADNRDMGLSQRMGPEITELPPGFRWISRHSVAAPYHLSDMAGDLLALADHLGLGRFAVAGFSMGGMIAQHMAIGAPERVSALASLSSCAGDPVVEGTAENDWMISRFFLPHTSREALLDTYCESAEFYSGGRCPADAPATRSGADRLIARMEAGGGDRGGYLRQAFAITDTPGWAAGLGQIAAPALVIHGSDDPCLPAECGRLAAARIPGAVLKMQPGLGHWISDAAGAELCHWLEMQAAEPLPA